MDESRRQNCTTPLITGRGETGAGEVMGGLCQGSCTTKDSVSRSERRDGPFQLVHGQSVLLQRRIQPGMPLQPAGPEPGNKAQTAFVNGSPLLCTSFVRDRDQILSREYIPQ